MIDRTYSAEGPKPAAAAPTVLPPTRTVTVTAAFGAAAGVGGKRRGKFDPRYKKDSELQLH